MALYFCSQELGKKESSGTQGNIFMKYLKELSQEFLLTGLFV